MKHFPLLLIAAMALVGCGKTEPVQPSASNTEATKPEKETGKEATQPTTPNTEATKPEPTKAAERPNIIIILVDDMGFSDIGAYGGEIKTPHIDSLAQGGYVFLNSTTPRVAARHAPR